MVEYRFSYYRALVTIVLAALGAAAIGMIVALLAGAAGPPAAFALPWLAIYGWNLYWFGFRVACTVRLAPDGMTWKALVGGGEVAYDRIRVMRPMLLASNVEVIEVADGRSILMFAGKGLREFGDDLRRVAPHAGVRFGWQARFSEWMGPRIMGWRREVL